MKSQVFLWLIYYHGLHNLNFQSLEIIFSNQDGLPVFWAKMSRLRFKFLSKHLCFDDLSSREQGWRRDRFTAVQDFFEKCNKQFRRCKITDNFLSFGEALYAMRTQTGFDQHYANKSAKYGLLFKSVISARRPYTNQTNAYDSTC